MKSNIFVLFVQKNETKFGGGKAPHQKKIEIYFLFNIFQNFLFYFIFGNFSNLHERSGIGWIERKTKFPIFSICYFLSYGYFCTQNDPNFRWIFTHNSKNLFSFSSYSAHSASGPVIIKDMQTPPHPSSSEMVETLWKMRNVVNRTGKIT